MGGRHKAPAATAGRARLRTRASAALRRPGRHTSPAGAPGAWIWLLAEAGAVALIVAVTGVLVVASHVLVDWREPVLGAALLFAPLAVRHVVLGVRNRWAALAAGYVAHFGLGYAVLCAAQLLWSSTIGGFLAATVGMLLCGAAFYLVSNLRRSRPSAPRSSGAETRVHAVSAPPVDPAAEAATGPLRRVSSSRDGHSGSGTVDADPPTDRFARLDRDPDTEALPLIRPDEERRAQ